MKDLTYPLQIIKILADGQFHSGEKIAKSLGISRVAVHYYIQHIKGLGLEVHAVPKRGYQLYPALSLLSSDYLQQQLPHSKIHVIPIINSTNTYMMERLTQLEKGECCLAEYQHAGRGRRGRHWVAPFGQNIYLSLYWRFDNYLSLAGLSLTCAIIIAETLITLTQQPIKVKWPNDLYLHNKKLAGILIESSPADQKALHTVIGIGINVQMSHAVSQDITQQWTNLYTEETTAQPLDRNHLLIQLIAALHYQLAHFEQHGFADYLERWHRIDGHLNQTVKLITADEQITGIYRGINSAGELLLESNNQLIPFNRSDISLRRLVDESS